MQEDSNSSRLPKGSMIIIPMLQFMHAFTY